MGFESGVLDMAISSSKGMMAGAVALGLGGCALVGFGTYAGINSSLDMGRTRMERIMATKQAGPQSDEVSAKSDSEDVSSQKDDATSGGDVESSSDKTDEKNKAGSEDSKDQAEDKPSGASGHADVDDGSDKSDNSEKSDSASKDDKSDKSEGKGSEDAPKVKDGEYAVYAVTWGDVLDSVSERSGISVDELARINGVSDLTLVCTETTIRVPAGVTLRDPVDMGRG